MQSLPGASKYRAARNRRRRLFRQWKRAALLRRLRHVHAVEKSGRRNRSCSRRGSANFLVRIGQDRIQAVFPIGATNSSAITRASASVIPRTHLGPAALCVFRGIGHSGNLLHWPIFKFRLREPAPPQCFRRQSSGRQRRRMLLPRPGPKTFPRQRGCWMPAGAA